MKRTRKLVTVAVLAVAVVVSAITAAYALSANTTETYAYLPEHSVYFYDTAGEPICFIRATPLPERTSSLCSTAPLA